MADLQRLVGGMLASGMGGRSRRGPTFASSPFPGAGPSGMAARPSSMAATPSGMGGLGNMAGLGALAYLAYKAYQEYQKTSPGTAGAGTAGGAGTGTAGTARAGAGTTSRQGGRSLGDRIDDILSKSSERAPEPEPAALDDAHALLLIRAMIAAANADGQITPDERQRITSKLEQAGAGPDERTVLARELDNPRSVDQIVREVKDQETALQVYLASRIAMNPDTAAERAYLDFLAARLEIPADRLSQLNAVA
jgi:uncharacterized membrane protein YebE (DUF533 family)